MEDGGGSRNEEWKGKRKYVEEGNKKKEKFTKMEEEAEEKNGIRKMRQTKNIIKGAEEQAEKNT